MFQCRHSALRALALGAVGCCTLLTQQAFAQEQIGPPSDVAVEEALEGVKEKPGKQYLFVGARYRAVIVPKFVQNLFADGGETFVSHTPGLDFAIRKDGFEYNLFAQLGIYSAEDVPFKGANDEVEAWEITDFDYQILFLGSDFMWSSDEFAPGLSMTYGAGVGLGLVFGALDRTEAFPDDPNDLGNPDNYRRCPGPGASPERFCDVASEGNYGEEPTWADGGSSPLVFPWIAAQVGMRYKISRNFVTRLELGVLPTGAFVGLGAAYGL